MAVTMSLEFALNAGKPLSRGSSGRNIPADGGGTLRGCFIRPERVAFYGGSKCVGVSLRLAHAACSDSAQAPPQPRRKKAGKVDGPTATELKLLKDLQEFIASCDLPPHEVPTTAELARNGRQDLANQVRRRGYKLVTQLLEQVRTADTGENNQSENVTAPHDSVVTKVSGKDGVEFSLAKLDETVSNDLKETNDVGSSNGGGFEVVPLSLGFAIKHANVNGNASHKEEEVVGESLGDQQAEAGKDQRITGEAAAFTSEEVLIQESNQDSPIEDGRGTSQPADLLLGGTEGEGDVIAEAEYETNDMDEEEEEEEEEECYEDDHEDDGNMQIPVRPDPKSQSTDSTSSRKAVLLRARLQQYFDSRSRSEDSKQQNSFPKADVMKEKVVVLHDQPQSVQSDVRPQATKKFETGKELEQLQGLLDSRELELAEISRQLEEAKGMLSLARAKATAELIHEKQLAVEQDVQLHATEQALSQMKQVHLEWWGEAGRVEVAGSFNGWQHNICLEPDGSSEIPKPGGARGPMMWGTHLFLYPGVYEIKFIVDGIWQVDHRREVIMQHTNQNNILRVE